MPTTHFAPLAEAPPEVEAATLAYLAAWEAVETTYLEASRLLRLCDSGHAAALAEHERAIAAAYDARERLRESFAGQRGRYWVANRLVVFEPRITTRDDLSVRSFTHRTKGPTRVFPI